GPQRGGRGLRGHGAVRVRDVPMRAAAATAALGRPRTLASGLAVLAAVWVWPLPALGLPPFSAHMTMHVAVVAVAAPLVAAGLAGGRLDPVIRRPDAFPPIVASML